MFTDDLESGVLLGRPDPARAVDPKDPYASHLGGTPAWLNSASSSAAPARPQCGICGGPLHLVLQVYAPVEFPRALYVYGCNRAECQQAGVRGSWRVLRQQLNATSAAAGTSSTDATNAAHVVDGAGDVITGAFGALGAVVTREDQSKIQRETQSQIGSEDIGCGGGVHGGSGGDDGHTGDADEWAAMFDDDFGGGDGIGCGVDDELESLLAGRQ